jgi:hypothetical protein
MVSRTDKPLAIFSVYASGSLGLLYATQSLFIKETTTNYQHIVVAAEQPPINVDNHISCKKSDHCAGLRAICWHLRTHRNRYGTVLIADSDAFPVRQDWQKVLDTSIAKHKKLFAAPVRTENHDFFPHISFLYFPMSSFDAVAPHLQRGRGRIISGRPGFPDDHRVDVAAGLPLASCFPLLWTVSDRKWPLLHVVYGDIAYHRGGGSRSRRAIPFMTANGYWKSILGSPAYSAKPITKQEMNSLLSEQRFA